MNAPDLSPEQLSRYARQIVLDDFGAAGQGALDGASVLVVGAGGLGSPVIMYLAGAGIGHLTIADDDVVERSNLHRQLLHAEADLGRPKVDSAAEWIREHNPDVDVDPIEVVVDETSIDGLLDGHDLVLDATDRFATRFLLNDAATLAGVPLVYGAVYRFEGQVGLFDPGESGPCYRCVFPEAPPPGTVPDCATAGVLGPVPGVIGALQAGQAITYLADIGEPPRGRLLVIDIEAFTVESIDVVANPSCPVCGPEASLESVDEVDYSGRCGIS